MVDSSTSSSSASTETSTSSSIIKPAKSNVIKKRGGSPTSKKLNLSGKLESQRTAGVKSIPLREGPKSKVKPHSTPALQPVPGKSERVKDESCTPGKKMPLQKKSFQKFSKDANLHSKSASCLSLLSKNGSSKSLKKGSSSFNTSDHKLSINTKSKSSTSLQRNKSQYSQGGFDSPASSVKSAAHDESDLTNNTALFEKNLDIYRKFRVAVRETEDCIQNHHDRALKRVQERVMKETLESKLEVESRLLKEESVSIKQSFVLEADVAKEDQEQLRALKIYHQLHIQRLLPMWFKSLNDTTRCIAANGHSEKLQWRSQSRKLLLCALQEMEDDDSSGVVKAKVRYLALSINARKAQQVLHILKLIREEYIRHKEGGSDLGHHSSELRRVRGLLNPDKPCLLARGQWSSDLESNISHAKERTDSSLLHHSAYGYGQGSTIQSIDDEFTLDSTDGGGGGEDNPFGIGKGGSSASSSQSGALHNSYEFSSMEDLQKGDEETSTQPFPDAASRQKNANSFMLSTSSAPVDPHNSSEIMRLLREASCQGLLAEAWKVFTHFYGEYINNVKDKVFLHMNLKSVPTLDTFKLLLMAFKNSDSDQFDDVSTIFILMKRANIEPDLESFNMVLRACERRGAWRRALKYLKIMEADYGIVPNTNSFGIVIDSCRHAPEAPTVIFDTLRNEKFPRKFCYQAAACNAGNRISTVAATDLFIETFQNEPNMDFQTVGNLRRSVTTAAAASSAFAPSKQWGIFNDKMSKSLNWKSPAFHRTGPSVPAFQSQVLKILAPNETLITASTNIKSGAVLATGGGSSVSSGGSGGHAGGTRSTADGEASVGSAVTFDTFDASFASFKDLNKIFVPGAELEDSLYDTSVASPGHKAKSRGEKIAAK